MGRNALSLVAAFAVLLPLGGCASSGGTEATKAQEKAFEGAPMPPGAGERAQAELAKAREEAAKRAADARAGTTR